MGNFITAQNKEDSKENIPPQDLIFDEESIFKKEVEEEMKKFPDQKIQKVLVFENYKEKEEEFNPEEIKNSSKKVINFGQMTYEDFLYKIMLKIDKRNINSIINPLRLMKIKNGFYLDDDRFIFNFSYLPFKKIIQSNEAIIHLTRFDKELECEYNIKGVIFHGCFSAYVDYEFYDIAQTTEYFTIYDQDLKWSQWKVLCNEGDIHPFNFKDGMVTTTKNLSKCDVKDDIFFDYKHFKLQFKSYENYGTFHFDIVPNNKDIEHGNIIFMNSQNRFALNFNGNFNQIEYLFPNHNPSQDLKNSRQFTIYGNLKVQNSNLILTTTDFEASQFFKNDQFTYILNHRGEHGVRYKNSGYSVNFFQNWNQEFYIDLITICKAHKIPIKKEFNDIKVFKFNESKYHSNIGIFELRGVKKDTTSKVFIFFYLNEAKFNLEIYIDYENIILFPIYDSIQHFKGDLDFKFA